MRNIGLRFVLAFFAAVQVASFSSGEDGTSVEERQDALIEAARLEGDEFEVSLAEARDAGVPEAWLLEAEIVRALTSGDMEALLTMPERIDPRVDAFRVGLGRTFISRGQLEGFSDTIKCVMAYQAEDMDLFEKLAVSSFAKAPDFNKLFGIGQLLSRYRIEQVQALAMAGVGIPLDMQVANIEGEKRSLRDWMGDNEYMLIDFWASWCGPCIQLMPELRKKAEGLPEQGVFVAAFNIDKNGQLEKANKTRLAEKMETVPWLLDPQGKELSGLLMVDSIPRMVLFDREGIILYNGHPSDPELGTVLAKVGVRLADLD